MADVNLNALDPMKFLELMPLRKQKIAEAPATPLPKDYPVNALARALHPKRQALRVAEVIVHSDEVKTFVLQPDATRGTKACAYFSAGQYVNVFLSVGKAKVNRPYSLSSSPKDALEGKYAITVKRVGDGLVSQYILDNWEVGTEVEVSAPDGHLTYEPLRDAKTVVGVAGGSGITPFLSLANAIADGDEEASLILLYGSRTEADILFKKEFDALVAKCDKIKVVHVLSHEEKEGFEKGFVTADVIGKYAPAGDYSIFLCGPQQMYDFVDKEIEKLGLLQKFVRHELFGEFHNPAAQEDYPKVEGEDFTLTVKIKDKVQTIPCNANDSILATLEKHGIAAPSRCRSGACGFCRSRLIKGDVYVPKSIDGRRLADFKFGYIHPCCSFALGDVEIEVPADI